MALSSGILERGAFPRVGDGMASRICRSRTLCSSSTRQWQQPYASRFICNTSTAATGETSDRAHEKSGRSLTRLTFLEGNSWLWEVGVFRILVDPVLVGNLDFGVPWLYNGAKKKLINFKLEDLGRIDCMLITQSLDDHCHSRTLKQLARMYPQLDVIATPNAEPILSKLFTKVTYIQPTESTCFQAESGQLLKVTASAGPVLGPPWQRPENGYFVETSGTSIYIEPHCVYDKTSFGNKTVDILITPIIKQKLPFFTLVSGQEDAVELAKELKPKCIVAMLNGDLNATGFLSKILKQDGTLQDFKNQLGKFFPNVSMKIPEPGIPLDLN